MISSRSKFPMLASKFKCTGCMACVAVCPRRAIRQVINAEGHIVVQLDRGKCIGCLKCEKMCYGAKENYGSNNLNQSIVYCGWAQEETFRRGGTSGGVFAAIAASILNEGGIVFGATFDGRQCKHIAIECIGDIH